MSVAITPTVPPVVAGAAPSVTPPDTQGEAPASFATTLHRSRLALATEPAKTDGADAAAPARKAGTSREEAVDGTDAPPDALAVLLASAAMVSHVKAAAPRAPAAGEPSHRRPLLVTREPAAGAPAAAADATPAALNPPESRVDGVLAVPDRLAAARPAPGMDRARDRAAAPPAAMAAPAAARAAAPAPDAGAAPGQLAAAVDLAALAGHARVQARGDTGTPTGSHALPSSGAPDATAALSGAADGAAGALITSAPLGPHGRASHDQQSAVEDSPDTPSSPTLTGAAPTTNDAAMPAPDVRGAVAPPVGSSEWAPALAQQIARLGPGRSQIELDLHPAELGPLTVKLTVGAAQAQVMFVSEHAAVREALQAALPQLRTTLADSGISLGQASVGGGGGGGGQASTQPGGGEAAPRREAQPRPARTDADAPLAAARTGGRPGLDAFA